MVHTRLPRAVALPICRRLLVGGALAGAIGLGCWIITIVNVGGFVNAFSASYAGGWDDSGYVRDGSLLMLVGVLLSVTSLALRGPAIWSFAQMAIFALPWLAQALLTARRGPTFAITVILLMGWYMARRRRPPVLAVAAVGLLLGWSVLFLVTNRQSIHLGADLSDVKTDVTEITDKPDTGNEYIYGGGSVLSAQRRDHYFWMRRYLAQIMVRPIPSAIWPTKYEDFGVPELLKNGGTGEGIGDAMGWEGAVGSAPGIVADLWVEMWWLAIPAMAALGLLYGFVWRRAVTRGGPWTAQYVVLSALSIYLVMQTMEAVIFRTLLLSAPCWITWSWALRRDLRSLGDLRDRSHSRTGRRLAGKRCLRFGAWNMPELATLSAPEQMLQSATPGSRRCRVVVIWIDWYAYHLARFAGLCGNPELAGSVVGIELVGGIGVHAGLRFREERAANDDLPVETLFPHANWGEAGQWRIARALWAKLNALDPEVVLVPGYYTLPGIAAALWARLHRRASVLMTESTEGDHRRTRWKEWLKSLVVRGLFDWAVAGGTAHLRYLQALGFPLRRAKRFYDVVDNRGLLRRVQQLRKASAPKGSPYFLYVGRLAPEKNIGGLLEAYLAYRTAGGSWRLVLAGDGPERQRLEEIASGSPYAGEVHFAGHMSSAELPPYYAFAGCFVLPSTREPWGLVVNEAMACGLPVLVSTRCGCVEDLLIPGVTGWSFDAARPDELSARMADVEALSLDARAEMSRQALAHIAGYSPERFAEGIAAIAATK